MMSFIFTMLVPVFAATLSTDPNTEYREYDFNALDKMKISNTSGKTTITPMPINKVIISVTKKKFSEDCKLEIERPTIDVINTVVQAPANEACEADIDIQAPTDVALDIASTTGDVAIDGMKGSLKLNTTTGNIKAKSGFKDIDVKSDKGNIELDKLTAGGKVETRDGKVEVKFLDNPSGDLTVKTEKGAADVRFPKGTKLNASVGSKEGLVDDEFTTYTNGYKVNVQSDAGNIDVRSY